MFFLEISTINISLNSSNVSTSTGMDLSDFGIQTPKYLSAITPWTLGLQERSIHEIHFLNIIFT